MTSDIFQYHIVRGFTPKYDTILQADLLRQDSHEASKSSNIRLRRAFAKALADDVNEMMAERDFHLFFDNVYVSSLLSLYSPNHSHAKTLTDPLVPTA